MYNSYQIPKNFNNSYYKSGPSQNNNDRLIGGGFLGPFLLGGVTGGLVAPLFYGGYNRPYYNNYYYYPYPPVYGPYYRYR